MGRGEGQRAAGDCQKPAPASPGRDGSESKSSTMKSKPETTKSKRGTTKSKPRGTKTKCFLYRQCAFRFPRDGQKGRLDGRCSELPRQQFGLPTRDARIVALQCHPSRR